MKKLSRNSLKNYSTVHKETQKNSLNYKISSQILLNRCSSVEIIHPFTANEESSIKDHQEPTFSHDSKIQRIEELEKKLRETEEKHKVDTENMQSYINLLRKKVQSGKGIGRDSLKKDRSLGYLSANKPKEPENRDSASNQIFSAKIQMLSLDKNKLELALLDAEKDMKRLYEEIKYQSEIITNYKDKNSSRYIEEIKERALELERQLEEEKKKGSEVRKAREETEDRARKQEQEILYLQEQVRFYEDSDIPKEVKKYQILKKSEQLLESAKIACKDLIHKFSKEINEKLNQLTLKTQKLENEENKINHLFKLLQHRVNTSGMANLAKITREFEITKKELEEAMRENYDLHETLEQMNYKSLQTQDKLVEENKKLKSLVRNLSDMKRLN